jgi:hypothetical protein
MSEFVDFIIKGTLDDVEISPTTINFTRFNEFNRQVEEFVAGSDEGTNDKLQLDTVYVQVLEGSYRLRLVLSLALVVGVESVLRVLSREDSLADLDKRRAKIVEKWQLKAHSHENLTYEIQVTRSDGREAPSVRIGGDTNFRHGEQIPWVRVEKYLFGQIVDMGGAKAANVHVKVGSDILIVNSDRDYLRGNDKNLLYRDALLRVSAEENTRSGELRKMRLIHFVEYNPTFDQAALDRFAEEGAKAWADVPDGAAWVKNLREG